MTHLMRLDELFSREINPDKHVACIGADESIERDPSGFFAATLLHGKKGKLYFLDKQSRTLRKRLILSRAKNASIARRKRKLIELLDHGRSKAGGAVGDPKKHAEQIRSLIKNGIEAKEPIVKIAQAWKTGFPDKSIVTIIDAGSLPWIVFGEELKKWKKKPPGRFFKVDFEQPAILEPILREYGRVASKAILLAEPTNPERVGGGGDGNNFFPKTEVLIRALFRAGAKSVKEMQISNEYKVNVLPHTGMAPFLHHGYNYSKALVAEW